MSIYHTYRLQKRILLLAMAGILTTGLLVGLATAIPLYQQTRAHSELAMEYQVQSQTQTIAQLLEKYRDIAQQFSSRSQIRERLEMYNRGEISRQQLQDYTAPRMADALDQASDVLALLRLDARGLSAVILGEVPEGMLSLEGNSFQRSPHLHGLFSDNVEPYLLVSSPIINRQGEVVGSDWVAFRLNGLTNLLSRQHSLSEGSKPYLRHRTEGQILGLDSSNKAYIGSEQQLDWLLDASDKKQALVVAHDSLLFHHLLPNLEEWQLLVTVPQESVYLPARLQLLPPVLAIMLMLAGGLLITARMIRPLSSEVVDASRRLSELSQEQQVLLDLAHGFAFRLDSRGVIHYATPGIEQVLGIRQEELPLHQSLLFEDNPTNAYGLEQLRLLLGRAEEIPSFRLEARHANGKRVSLEIHARSQQEDGKVIGVRGIARDIGQGIDAERARLQSAQEWSYAMDFFEHAIYLVDLDDIVIRANRAFLQLLGLPRDQVIGRNIVELMHPQGETEECLVCRARRLRQDAYVTMDADDPDNPTQLPIEVSTRIIHDSEGQPSGVLMGIQDLSRVRQTEEDLRLAASVFEGSREGILIMAANYQIIDANQAFCEITGYPLEQVHGRLLKDFVDIEAMGKGISEQIWQRVEQHGSWQGELWYRRGNGELFPTWQNLSLVRDEQGKVLRFIGIFTDITEQKATESRIQHLAHYDVLTDLPNRILLQDRLQGAMERMQRKQGQLAVLFIDLDRFKNVNDSLGHPIGDRLLKIVAERLADVIRDEDTVARHGGDEFLIILEDLKTPQHAGLVARKILDKLAQPLMVAPHQLYIGASIGISLYPNDGVDTETLIKNADTAMYLAKESGRNTYQYYTPELTQLSLERFELERDLRQALERNELLLHYQPQATLNDEQCIGAEALVRWKHPQRGLIPPDRFISLAEETGLILELGKWVLEEACRQTHAWHRQGVRLRIAVNLSGKQIIHGDIVQTVHQVLQESGLEPHWLELEITEGFVLSHAVEGIETLEHLKQLGISLAIDDFGTGYSSLSYLKRLPIDRLKIDKSFVQGIPEDSDDIAIATTIIAMARNLRLEVIAEGVETRAQQDFMLEKGCNEFQGYLLSRPLPADEFITWWRNYHRKK